MGKTLGQHVDEIFKRTGKKVSLMTAVHDDVYSIMLTDLENRLTKLEKANIVPMRKEEQELPTKQEQIIKDPKDIINYKF